jgi:hypothetical protein
MDEITEFHFVDNMFLPKLPNLECRIEGVKDPVRNERSNRDSRLLSKVIIGNAKAIMTENNISDEIIKQLHEHRLKPTGFRNKNTQTYMQEWLYMPKGNKKIEVYRHVQDGLVTFMTLDKISVFFLRGDSEGEGGSGQRWFQERIFNLILDKLVDGGLIVTDGSSWNPEEYETAQWKSLWKNRYNSKRDNLQKPDDFLYSGRKFICIGECGHRYGPVYVWKVIKDSVI